MIRLYLHTIVLYRYYCIDDLVLKLTASEFDSLSNLKECGDWPDLILTDRDWLLGSVLSERGD